jgi:hypothetical protein
MLILARWNIVSLEQLSWMSPTRCEKAVGTIPVGQGTWEGEVCELLALNDDLWRKRLHLEKSAHVECSESDDPAKAGGLSDALRLRLDPSIHGILEKWNVRSLKQLSWMSPERCRQAVDALPASASFELEGQLCNLRALNSKLWRERLKWDADVSWFESEDGSDALRNRLDGSVRGSCEPVLRILAAWNIHSLTQLSWMSPERCDKAIDALGADHPEGQLCDLRKLIGEDLAQERIEEEDFFRVMGCLGFNRATHVCGLFLFYEW